MSNSTRERIVMTGLMALGVVSLGCDTRSPVMPVVPAAPDQPAVVAGVPSVQAISPTLGVTTGGTSIEILGAGFHFGTSVTLDGVVMQPFLHHAGSLGFTTPPHASGPVEIVVVYPGGEARLPRAFTYAAPGTFDFNGTWKGQADGPPDSVIDMSFTIVNNRLISVSCGGVTVTLSPAASVGGGEFSFSGEKDLVLTGRMLSSATAVGEIHAPPCGPTWYAVR